jgi:hypothetical protein
MTARRPRAAQGGGSEDLCIYIPGAAVLLRTCGMPLSARRVGALARLARSFARDGMGRFEALARAAVLLVRS